MRLSPQTWEMICRNLDPGFVVWNLSEVSGLNLLNCKMGYGGTNEL